MKTIPAPLLAHYALPATSLAYGLKLTRTDATVYGFTSSDVATNQTGDGVLYRSAPGLDVSSLVSSAGFAVDNAEITVLTDDTLITRPDVLAGRWDGAAFVLFEYNARAPAQGMNVLKTGRLGNLQPRRGAYVAELRGLRQALQIGASTVTQPNCRNRLGDARCGVPLGPITHAGTVTAVTGNAVFTDSALAQPADYFGAGDLTWVTGLNAGLSVKVSAFASGQFTLARPMALEVQVGDTFTAVRGCRRRLEEDCVAVYANVLNFWGEAHLPGRDRVTAVVDEAG